jgi:hypothetical protein
MIQGLKNQSCHKKPPALDQDCQENKPEISLLKSAENAFQFAKTEIDKRGAKEDHQDEYKFPHIGKIIHKQTPAKPSRVFASREKALFLMR